MINAIFPESPNIEVTDKKMQGKISFKGGASIILSAKVTGVPKPSVTWQQNGTTLEATETTTMEREDEFCRIVIKSCEAKNGGEYKLVAENTVGSAEHTFDVVVKGTVLFLKMTVL